MSSILKNVVAVKQSVGDVSIIGHLTWYSLSEMLITRDELKKKMVEAGLGEGFMPHEIRLPDAFRRATSKKFRHRISEAVVENYLFREVASDNRMIQRNIVCEVVDQKGRRLAYDGAAATLVLDKTSAKVTVSAISRLAEELARDAVTKFEIYRHNYGTNTIRSVIMSILKSMAPTPVRPSGGVYFVPARHTDRLEAMLRFVKLLDHGEGEKVPLIDTTDMRNLITRKLLDHLRETLRACEEGVSNQLPKGQMKEILEHARQVAQDYVQYKAIITGDLKEMEELVAGIREKVSAALINMAV
ncbi:MAG: hypothetical protein BAA01_03745 [Bacillus thermozeamaize]|uniref:Uncharacterized protein n=1 Tax=Bacillus thermozeamaize TaxID=230954 RepID=A0A1Y3PDI9_9BACI|nr:MAG: hypothetical protein BAA01_03745 [Bacillus thermozeamaize]